MLKGLYHTPLSYLCILIREEIALSRGDSSWNIKRKKVRIDAAKNLHNAVETPLQDTGNCLLTKTLEKKLDGVYTRVLRTALDIPWQNISLIKNWELAKIK